MTMNVYLKYLNIYLKSSLNDLWFFTNIYTSIDSVFMLKYDVDVLYVNVVGVRMNEKF